MFEQNIKMSGCQTVKEIMERIHEKDGGLDKFLKTGEKTKIRGLSECITLISEAMEQEEPVTIVGDYDCDGIMGSIILYLSMLIRFKKKTKVRLPKRFTEGYGLSMKIIDEISGGVIFCVDNGIAAVEQIKAAKEKGLKVIVMDHHLIRDDGKLPECDVLVDPHVEELSDFDDFCGAGLAYRFAEELLGEDNPYLPDLLVMASVATVADMVELVKDNRQLLIKGLAAANNGRGTKGLRHLISVLGIEHIDEETCGFMFGPICNASGRLKDDGAYEVFEFLYIMNKNHDYEDLADRANALIETNHKRKEMVKEAMSGVTGLLEQIDKTAPIVLETDIPEGIVGIIAGNLAEEYHVPVLVFTRTENENVLKGSGRSGDSCHLKKLLDKSGSLFIKYGGHAGAAGMSIEKKNLQKLRESLEKNYKDFNVSADAGRNTYDIEISEENIHEVLSEIRKYAPYGQGNRKPVFLIKGFECSPKNGFPYQFMGKDKEHIKLFGKNASAIGFDLGEKYINDGYPKKINILGTLSENYFNGNVYDQIEIIDYEFEAPKITEVQQSLMELLVF